MISCDKNGTSRRSTPTAGCMSDGSSTEVRRRRLEESHRLAEASRRVYKIEDRVVCRYYFKEVCDVNIAVGHDVGSHSDVEQWGSRDEFGVSQAFVDSAIAPR